MNWEIRTIINQETPRVDFRMLNKTGNWATIGWVKLTDATINVYSLDSLNEHLFHKFSIEFLKEYANCIAMMANYAEKVKWGLDELGTR